MQTRAISSLLVVVIGLVAVILGGPVFTFLFICLGAAGYREYLALAARINRTPVRSSSVVGYGAIVGLGLIALFAPSTEALFTLIGFAVTAPLVMLIQKSIPDGAFSAWSLVSTGSLYLGLPVYAAIALRSTPGSVGMTWGSSLTESFAFGWNAAPRGFAWAAIVIAATWVGDTLAYLVGSTWGTKKFEFAAAVSPHKTVEGAVGGLVGSMSISAVMFPGFGLGPWWVGIIIGGVLGVAGQLGDLAESLLKRQAAVKDSGAVLPGHGGILDRIDALLFAFPVGFVIAAGLERMTK